MTQLLPTKHETKPILGALHATHPLCRRCETRTTLSARPETSRFPIYYRRFRGLVSIICVDRYLSDVWHAAPKFGLITEGLLEAQRVGDGWFHCALLATDDIIGGSRDYYDAELAHRVDALAVLAGKRVLYIFDSTSPILAGENFRRSSLSVRFRALCDDWQGWAMAHKQRLESITYWWLHSHCGHLPEAAVDALAKQFLRGDPVPLPPERPAATARSAITPKARSATSCCRCTTFTCAPSTRRPPRCTLTAAASSFSDMPNLTTSSAAS